MMKNLGLKVIMRFNYTSVPIITDVLCFKDIYDSKDLAYRTWIYFSVLPDFFPLQNLCNSHLQSKKCLDRKYQWPQPNQCLVFTFDYAETSP